MIFGRIFKYLEGTSSPNGKVLTMDANRIVRPQTPSGGGGITNSSGIFTSSGADYTVPTGSFGTVSFGGTEMKSAGLAAGTYLVLAQAQINWGTSLASGVDLRLSRFNSSDADQSDYLPGGTGAFWRNGDAEALSGLLAGRFSVSANDVIKLQARSGGGSPEILSLESHLIWVRTE